MFFLKLIQCWSSNTLFTFKEHFSFFRSGFQHNIRFVCKVYLYYHFCMNMRNCLKKEEQLFEYIYIMISIFDVHINHSIHRKLNWFSSKYVQEITLHCNIIKLPKYCTFVWLLLLIRGYENFKFYGYVTITGMHVEKYGVTKFIMNRQQYKKLK